LDGPVVDLRPATRDCYRNALQQHLLKWLATRRLDSIAPDDLVALIRDLREKGLAESTIVIVIGVVNRIYRFAARRIGWFGQNPVSLLLPSERPRPAQAKRRRLFEGEELEQTISAADEPFRSLFTVAALSGARLSELLALRWMDVRIGDVDDAEVEFAHQLIGRATFDRRRQTTRPGRFRFRGSWRRFFFGIKPVLYSNR
jgi:integrase